LLSRRLQYNLFAENVNPLHYKGGRLGPVKPMKFRKVALSSLALLSVSIFLQTAALSAPADGNQTLPPVPGRENVTDKPTAQYDELVGEHNRSAHSYLTEAQRALRDGRIVKATALARKAMNADPQELDAHLVLAQALERRLDMQVEKDQRLLGECVRHWLVVLRAGVGEEAGNNFKGAGVLDSLYRDDEHFMEAKEHLKKLVGRAPKAWETNERYVKKVLSPQAELSATGKIVSGK